jgi:hypothetical protein
VTFDPRARQLVSPQPGCWLIRLTKGGPRVAARIWRVETVVDPDFPENGMVGTRSPFLAAEINGEIVDIDKVWLVRGEPISEQEYRWRVADAAWAATHAPDEAIANPRKKIDWLQARIPF